jgi:hypothetical protein
LDNRFEVLLEPYAQMKSCAKSLWMFLHQRRQAQFSRGAMRCGGFHAGFKNFAMVPHFAKMKKLYTGTFVTCEIQERAQQRRHSSLKH